MSDEPKLFVLGIDGANYKLIDRWSNELPNLQQIMQEGSKNKLLSSTPPITSPAWRCYATGKDPNNIGVYWWRQLNKKQNGFIGADEIPLDSTCYWEYLSDRGIKSAIVGIPLNTPPRKLKGKMISGGPFANQNNYTYPSNLQETIEEEFDYQLHPEQYPNVETARDENIITDFKNMIDQRFDVIEWLIETESPDFVNLTLFYINTLHHKAWDSSEVLDVWKLIDERIGRILDQCQNLIIHSDHGMHKVNKVFYINSWLVEQDLLKTRDDISKNRIQQVANFLDKINCKEPIKYIVPKIVIDKLVNSNRRLVDSTSFENTIDFENSKLVALPQGPIYILDDSIDVNKIISDLKHVVDPDNDEYIFEDVVRTTDIYSKEVPDYGPDLMVMWKDGYEIKDIHNADPDRIFGPPHGVLADNAPTGVLIGYGPDISETQFDDIPYLYDLAPTILHLYNCSVPDDMDGEVIKQIYSTQSSAHSTPVAYKSPKEHSDSSHETADQPVNDRLRDLGYLE